MTPRSPAADPDFPRLKGHLIRATGLAYYADKDADLAARLARRMAARGVPDCGAYLGLLAGGPGGEAELDALITDLTIGETFFFRHREAFAALRDVVFPDLLARNRHRRRLRVWSAGCSVGAEPYSVAVLLRRELAAAAAGWDVGVVGTDINRAFLAQARTGWFEDWALRGVPDDVRADCFARAGRGWQLAPAYRAGVSFQYHNLVAHPFPSLLHDLADFDLILCRNVTIYFGPEITRRLVGQFHQTLAAGGWLVVGHAEPNVELFRAFRTVNADGAVLYQKAGDECGPPVPSNASIAAGVCPPLPRLCGSEGRGEGVGEQPNPPAPFPEREGGASGLEAVFAGQPPQPGSPPRFGEVPVEGLRRPGDDLVAVRALADRGAWAAAARACDELLARDRLNPAAHFYHGMVLEQLGRPADAERALRRVLYLDRAHALAHYHLALFLQRQGRLPDAAHAFRNALTALAAARPGAALADGDGITAPDLGKLVRMHLDALEGP